MNLLFNFEPIQPGDFKKKICITFFSLFCFVVIEIVYIKVCLPYKDSFLFEHIMLSAPKWLLVGNSILFVPMFEELVFRLPLKFSKTNIMVALIGIPFFFLMQFEHNHLFTELGPYFGIRVAIMILIAGGFAWFIQYPVVIFRLRDIWNGHGSLIFCLFLLLFVVAHFGRVSSITNIYSFIYLSWIFLMGFLLGYIRLRLGFLASVLFHTLNHLLPYLFLAYISIRIGE